MTTYKFTLQTLTPLHIGNGEELRKDFDYAVFGEGTWRLNTDLIWDKKYKEGGSSIPGKLLTEKDFRESRWFRYVVKGEPRSGKTDARLKACIKDVYDCPYVPGSSIKGAIRTALGKKEIAAQDPLFAKLSGSFNPRSLKSNNKVNGMIFGKDPYTDILRVFRISDLHFQKNDRQAGYGLKIINTTAISRKKVNSRSVPIELEAIDSELKFEGTITIDDYLLMSEFRTRKDFFDDWIEKIKNIGFYRLLFLKKWFCTESGYPVSKCQNIILQIKDLIEYKNRYDLKNQLYTLIQIGGGTGWDGITYGDLMQNKKDSKLLFPSSKKVVQDPAAGWKPTSLLGWCLLLFEKTEGSK